MAIELQEYVGAKPKKVSKNYDCFNLVESHSNANCIDNNSIMVDIEAIHSVITRNDTLYTEECIKNSVPFWTSPYDIPVIMHHNEKDGVIIGRVKAANYIAHSKRSGTAALELVANIGDENGIKGIKNGTLSTVSIGAIAHDLRCSICGTNLAEEGLCEHEKGEIYNNKKCYWIVNKIEPKEVSYVIVPSDMYAHNTNIYSVKENKKLNEVNESMSIFDELIKESGLDVAEAAIEKAKEEAKKAEEAKEEEKQEEPETESNKDKNEENAEKVVETTEASNEEKVVDVNEEGTTKTTTDENADKKVDDTEEEKTKTEPKEENKEEDFKKIIEELTAEVNKLKAENEKLLSQVKSEKALRESAESELVVFKAEKKRALIETINNLRAKVHLAEQDVNVLLESSEEMLNDNIKNLKEFVKVQTTTLAGLQQEIKSPAMVSEQRDNTKKEKKVVSNVKEASSNSNIDFEDEITSLLNKCWK